MTNHFDSHGGPQNIAIGDQFGAVYNGTFNRNDCYDRRKLYGTAC
ncbi:hypothetical protein [Candidatus Electronema sp. TJ]